MGNLKSLEGGDGKYRKKAVAELSSLYENRDRQSETHLLG
jgi:hypothetical protein